jgi:hypothetical protein
LPTPNRQAAFYTLPIILQSPSRDSSKQRIANMQTRFINNRARLSEVRARNILSDRKPSQSQHFPLCSACGRGFLHGEGRFCGVNCRKTFDAGMPVFAPFDLDKFYDLPKGPIGFWIDCSSCGKRFDSKGWRCCSIECSRNWRQKQDLESELANDPFRIEKPTCLECGRPMALWKNGRRVKSDRKFCSPKCQKRRSRKRRKGNQPSSLDLSEISSNPTSPGAHQGAATKQPDPGMIAPEYLERVINRLAEFRKGGGR